MRIIPSPLPPFRAFFKLKIKTNCCSFPCVQFTWLKKPVQKEIPSAAAESSVLAGMLRGIGIADGIGFQIKSYFKPSELWRVLIPTLPKKKKKIESGQAGEDPEKGHRDDPKPEKLLCEERLRELSLFSLGKLRFRGDPVTMFGI